MFCVGRGKQKLSSKSFYLFGKLRVNIYCYYIYGKYETVSN